jgi:hypothetical protein
MWSCAFELRPEFRQDRRPPGLQPRPFLDQDVFDGGARFQLAQFLLDERIECAGDHLHRFRNGHPIYEPSSAVGAHG